MAECKACGNWFSSSNPTDEICYVCEKALKRLNGYAVPVVRCKDCVHRKERVCCNPSAGMWVGVELKDGDFCSYGERKGDGE